MVRQPSHGILASKVDNHSNIDYGSMTDFSSSNKCRIATTACPQANHSRVYMVEDACVIIVEKLATLRLNVKFKITPYRVPKKVELESPIQGWILPRQINGEPYCAMDSGASITFLPESTLNDFSFIPTNRIALLL